MLSGADCCMKDDLLAIFHHKRHNKAMKVVEKDKVISGMLSDELRRCQEMLDNLQKSLSALPKGALNKRKKRYKDREYSYYYLKYRDGGKVINKHISNKKVKEILENLKLRKKYEKEIQSYKKKIAYLNKLMGVDKRLGNANRS
jgi:hypothetical protein